MWDFLSKICGIFSSKGGTKKLGFLTTRGGFLPFRIWPHWLWIKNKQNGGSQHYLSRDALAPGWRSSKKINKFWKWLKLAKTIRFGFIVLFYIWEPWDVCWFSSDFHKMSIANHLLTKWNWMLWLVKDLRKISGSSIFHLCSKQVKSRLVYRYAKYLPGIQT